jgi:hypothetical protein
MQKQYIKALLGSKGSCKKSRPSAGFPPILDATTAAEAATGVAEYNAPLSTKTSFPAGLFDL